jgi:hypothetical protein
MNGKPRRRWFAFRLRTLLLVVALASVPLAWVAVQLKWINDREKFVKHPRCVLASRICRYAGYKPEMPRSLRMLGYHDAFGQIVIDGDDQETLERAQSLFPEAEITWHVVEEGGMSQSSLPKIPPHADWQANRVP